MIAPFPDRYLFVPFNFHTATKRLHKHGNQADVIEAFNSTSRYLDDLLNIDNPYFEGMVNQIYTPELQLNKTNNTVTETPFWIYIFLLQMDLFLLKFLINAMTLILI